MTDAAPPSSASEAIYHKTTATMPEPISDQEGPDETPLLRDSEKSPTITTTSPLEVDGSRMRSKKAAATSSTPKQKKPPPKGVPKTPPRAAFKLLSTIQDDDDNDGDDAEAAGGRQGESDYRGGARGGGGGEGSVGLDMFCDADPALDALDHLDGDVNDGDYDDNLCPSSSANDMHGTSYSLAFCPSTPRWTVPMVSSLMLITHGLFLYGQLAPMWRLRATADVDVWANATTTLSHKTFDALGLDRNTHYTLDYDDDISTFTYGFAIKQLWAAAGLPNKTTSRLAAALLVIFSGVWPHLKLLLLHASFLLRRRERSRTTSLYWLGAFGKWTLADVFVVCVMIGIVNLDWTVDPAAVRDGLSEELPTLVMVAKSMYTPTEACGEVLGFDCDQPDGVGHRAKCWGCETAVNQAYSHPDWARGAGRDILKGVQTSGGGAVELRVAGMRGIYPFCAAAILSLLLGVVIDLLDHGARARCPSSSGHSHRAGRGGGGGGGGDGHLSSSSAGRFVLLLRRVMPRGGIETWCQGVTAWIGYGILIGASLLTTLLVVLGCTVPTMEREVIGAIPTVVHDVLGIAWERPYSLWSLVEVSGADGGPDYLLMGTFAIFVLVGPILRAALVVANLVLPMTEPGHEFFLTAINFVGAFCAWEVFAIAVVMIDDLVPTVTNTILQKPVCEQLSPEDGSCLEIEFNMLDSFVGLLVVAGTLLVLVSTVTVKLGFRGVDPYKDGDEGGPYCPELCPCRRTATETDERESNAYFHLSEDDMASDTEILL